MIIADYGQWRRKRKKKKKKVLNAHLTMMVIFDDGKYYSFKWQSKCNTLQNKLIGKLADYSASIL